MWSGESEDMEYLEAPGSLDASTPGGVAGHWPDPVTPIGPAQSWTEILPGVVNPPGWTRGQKEPHFRQRAPSCVKYIDDSLIIEQVNMKVPPLLVDNGVRFKSANPSRTQDLFDHIVRSATSKGMVVNEKKTGLMCISAATSFDPRMHLKGGDGAQIDGVDRLKVLGFFIDKDGGVWSQVNAVCARLRARSWALTKLRKCGLSTKDLIKVYKNCIRPCAEYASVVLHSTMSAEQADKLEAQQTQALRNIYGFGVSAAKMRARSGLETLRARRVLACTKFAESLVKSPRFSHWMERRQMSSYPRRGCLLYTSPSPRD